MDIKDLKVYVKFVFNIENSDDSFATSDIVALKDFSDASTYKVGDILDLGGIQTRIKDISLKHVNETVRSNSYGVNTKGNESIMQGELKDSLLTINILVEQLD